MDNEHRKRNAISMKGAVVIAKSTSVYARIDSALKEQAETILSALCGYTGRTHKTIRAGDCRNAQRF